MNRKQSEYSESVADGVYVLVAAIRKEERRRLEDAVTAHLNGNGLWSGKRARRGPSLKRGRKMSAATRAKMAASAKKRWRAKRKAAKA